MPKDKPIHEVRYGAIKAAIWRNETQHGIRYSVSLSRIYRDGQEWKVTESFGRDDLLVLGKVANEAHTWIHAQGNSGDDREREESGRRNSPPNASGPGPEPATPVRGGNRGEYR